MDISTLLTREIKLLRSPSELKGGTAQTGNSRQSIYTILGDCKQKLLPYLGGKGFLFQSFGDWPKLPVFRNFSPQALAFLGLVPIAHLMNSLRGSLIGEQRLTIAKALSVCVCVCVYSCACTLASVLSHLWLFGACSPPACTGYRLQLLCPWGFSRQEFWSGLPFPSPEDLPDPGIEPAPLLSSVLTGGVSTTSATWEALWSHVLSQPVSRPIAWLTGSRWFLAYFPGAVFSGIITEQRGLKQELWHC